MAARIIIVEDEFIIAAEIKAILESIGYQVVGQAKNGDQALDLFANRSPDLVLLDIRIKGTLNGIDLAKIIKSKYQFPFVFLTSHADINTLNEVKETLPYGYILKPFSENDLRSTIELALFKFQSEQAPPFPNRELIDTTLKIKLTQREYELYELLFQGKSYKEMAAQSEISVNTIKLHLKNLYSKIQVNSRHEATQLVIGMK